MFCKEKASHSLSFADAVQIARPREEVVPILVERHRHDPVGSQKRFLHSITMVDVNVNIQHPVVILQQLQNGQHNVIDITEA